MAFIPEQMQRLSCLPTPSGWLRKVQHTGLWACVVISLACGIVQATPTIGVKLVARGLAWPVAITHAGDGSGRLFFTLQGGKILIYDGTSVLPTPFLDLSLLVSCCGERGLFSIAFHPDYASNGYFYVNYTNTSGDTIIARYTVSGDPNVADPNSAFILLEIAQPFSNHNGGQLQFGPDGYLYIGMGDGGSGGDPQNNAQSLGTLLGKLLRIDVDGGSPYAIPPDNPFVGNSEARDEIWALGLRNPWRFSFDRSTHDLFIADVGQNNWEEVDFQPASSPGGENYGWRLMEGQTCFNPPSNCNDGTLTLPILVHSHSPECSITGGYRYRGTQIPQHDGTYFYGDFCSGRIWGATEDANDGWTTSVLLNTRFAISTFGEDEDGEIYFAHHAERQGAIYRIVEATSCPVLTTMQGAAEEKGTLQTIYRFRDEVLNENSEGRRYVRLFHRHAWEGNRLLLRHPALRVQTRAVLARLLPTLQAVVDGQPAMVTAADMAAIDNLFVAIAVKASPRLWRTIRQLRSDLHRGTLLMPFGIDIEGVR